MSGQVWYLSHFLKTPLKWKGFNKRSFDCKSFIIQFPLIYYKLKIVFFVTNSDDNDDRESLYGSNWK